MASNGPAAGRNVKNLPGRSSTSLYNVAMKDGLFEYELALNNDVVP